MNWLVSVLNANGERTQGIIVRADSPGDARKLVRDATGSEHLGSVLGSWPKVWILAQGGESDE
jgi:hypothetical protein